MKEDVEVIQSMIVTATDEGLLREVICSFGKQMSNQEYTIANVKEACICALLEWDI